MQGSVRHGVARGVIGRDLVAPQDRPHDRQHGILPSDDVVAGTEVTILCPARLIDLEEPVKELVPLTEFSHELEQNMGTGVSDGVSQAFADGSVGAAGGQGASVCVPGVSGAQDSELCGPDSLSQRRWSAPGGQVHDVPAAKNEFGASAGVHGEDGRVRVPPEMERVCVQNGQVREDNVRENVPEEQEFGVSRLHHLLIHLRFVKTIFIHHLHTEC